MYLGVFTVFLTFLFSFVDIFVMVLTFVRMYLTINSSICILYYVVVDSWLTICVDFSVIMH